MCGFRNTHFRRWVASGLAVLWLFTVLACAADTDAPAAAPAHSPQLTSSTHPVPISPPGDGTPDDACCRIQATGMAAPGVVALPQVMKLTATLPLMLLVLALPLTLLGMAAASDPGPIKRRSRLLVHSLQPQAPPR